jgi:hypothetical protein
MLLANAKHNGREKVVLSRTDGTCVDFSAALQTFESGIGKGPAVPATSIQSLLTAASSHPFSRIVRFVAGVAPDCVLPLAECKL